MNFHDAYIFGKKKHEGQKDDLGEDYFDTHCMHVVEILKLVTKDPSILIAGLLHDTLEDTKTEYDELKEKFGQRVADLVHEVTHEGQPDSTGYYFPRLSTLGAVLIKFADRLSNLSRTSSWSEERQMHYVKKSRFWKTGDHDVV